MTHWGWGHHRPSSRLLWAINQPVTTIATFPVRKPEAHVVNDLARISPSWPRKARSTVPTFALSLCEACLFLNTWPSTVNANMQKALHQGRGWSLNRNVLEHAVTVMSWPCIMGLVPERLQSTFSSYLIWSSQEPVRFSSHFTDADETERQAFAQSPRTSKCWVLSPKVPSLTSSIL